MKRGEMVCVVLEYRSGRGVWWSTNEVEPTVESSCKGTSVHLRYTPDRIRGCGGTPYSRPKFSSGNSPVTVLDLHVPSIEEYPMIGYLYRILPLFS